MRGVVVFSSCTKGKDDSVPVQDVRVQPSDYISDRGLLQELLRTRETILSQPKAMKGIRETYAFDLYVRKGRMYSRVYHEYYQPLKQALLDGTIPAQWFFLSGAYGIVNALEPAHDYQATFSSQIARQNDIPWTARLWRGTLPDICAHVVDRYPEWKVYVFGSQDYTAFLKGSSRVTDMRIIEGTGSACSAQLAPVLAEFVEALLARQLATFDKKFLAPFVKLPSGGPSGLAMGRGGSRSRLQS